MSLSIDITNPQPSYKPLDVLTGYVRYQINDRRNVKQLKLKLVGEVETLVTYETQEHTENGFVTKKHEAKDTAIALNTETVLATINGDIQPGNHMFPFTLQITNGTSAVLPNSFEHQNGKVRYHLKAEMERSGMMASNDRAERLIKVYTPIDTRAPQYNTPTTIEKKADAGCWWWKSGFVDAVIKVDRVAFHVGEQIPIQIQVTNNSSADVAVHAHIEMTGMFKAKDKTERVMKPVPSTDLNAVVPKSEKAHQKTYAIGLPANMDPGVDGNSTKNLINTQYDLVVRVSPATCCSGNVELRKQILISAATEGVGHPQQQQQQPMQQVVCAQPAPAVVYAQAPAPVPAVVYAQAPAPVPVYGQPAPIYGQPVPQPGYPQQQQQPIMSQQPQMQMPGANYPSPQYPGY